MRYVTTNSVVVTEDFFGAIRAVLRSESQGV